MSDPPAPTERLRLDVWLDVACLFRTRSEAQRACRGGKVDVNGQRAKPHREIAPGDRIAISRGLGARQQVTVRRIVEHHIPKAEARTLYDDVTPPPTPEEAELRALVRLASRADRSAARPPSAPGKRERRTLRRLKGRE